MDTARNGARQTGTGKTREQHKGRGLHLYSGRSLGQAFVNFYSSLAVNREKTKKQHRRWSASLRGSYVAQK